MMDARTMAEFVARRATAERRAVQRRVNDALAAIPAMVQVLQKRFGATGVWLFGSLAWGEAHRHTDLDLAVEGISPEEYFRALAAVDALAPIPVDLVRVEEVAPAFRQRIEREGRRVDAH